MSQWCVTFDYDPANIADDDLEKIDRALQDLNSSFSGPSSPSNAQAGQVWYDNTKKILRHAQFNGSTFRGIFAGSSSFKIWTYLDGITAEEGWARDFGVTDVVLGLQGSARYVAGGELHGSWILPNYNQINIAHTHSHAHLWFKFVGGTNNDRTYDSSGNLVDAGPGVTRDSVYNRYSMAPHGVFADNGGYDITSFGADRGTDIDATSGGGTHTPTHTDSGTWGIKAAVGIMVYPNI